MKILALNHKMNINNNEIDNYISEFGAIKFNSISCIVCPSLIYLEKFKKINCLIGSQNVGMMNNGALTGEVSASQLNSLGVNYSIVGHSERRTLLNETDEMINKKISLLLENNIKPILCVGETKEEYDNNKTLEVIQKELLNGLNNINFDNIIIAYEPIWSIGTGLVPTNNEIENVISSIKKIIKDNFNKDAIVLYGGSVNENNITELENINIVDGYLVGGASLKIDSIKKMVQVMEENDYA